MRWSVYPWQHKSRNTQNPFDMRTSNGVGLKYIRGLRNVLGQWMICIEMQHDYVKKYSFIWFPYC
jgi:hypothetical protein